MTDKQRERKTDKQTERRRIDTYGQTNKQPDKWTGRKEDKKTSKVERPG
jgi:hypothetical protein